MNKEIITFIDIGTKKRKFHHRKNLIVSVDSDIDDRQVFSVVSRQEKNYKYLTGYKDDSDYKVKPLCRMVLKLSA